MFGWRKRTKEIPVEETDAYKFGQRAANSMTSDLDAFMDRRFAGVFENYLAGGDAPPLTLARIEFNVFRENVSEMKSKMTDESLVASLEWVKAFDQVDGGEGAKLLVTSRGDRFCTDLTLAGLKLLTDYTEGLKDADIHWRKANPELSAKFPEPS